MLKAACSLRSKKEMTADGNFPDFSKRVCFPTTMTFSVHHAGTLLYPVSVSRTEALHTLQSFLPGAEAYARERNFDCPGNQAVSQLSPFIRHRLVTEEEVVRALLQQYPYSSVEKFVQEVCWRTYFKGYLEQHPDIWKAYVAKNSVTSHSLPEKQLAAYDRALHGETGIACFDAWVEELVSQGWLHNHARMWFASIWIFTLRLPWELGAAFFHSHLLDGDPASNTLSWRWVAGLHTRGKHYLARASNIRRYTRNRFNPVHQLNEAAPPLEPDRPFPLQPLVPVEDSTRVERINLSNCPAGLLVTPEDLTPEISCLSEAAFSSLCLLQGDDVLEGYQASANVSRFIAESFGDTADRLSSHWNGRIISCDGEVIPCVGKASPKNVGRKESMRIYAGPVGDWVNSVLVWAKNENLKSIWMMQPPVGPWADAVATLESALKQRNIRLITFRRRWDDVHWPHARNGYFGFKKGLRDRLELLL